MFLWVGAGHADAIDQLSPGQWYEVPNSHIRAVVPVPTPAGDPSNVVDAWSGGTYDTQGDRLLVWGGGHADYGGNEIYAFSLRSLTWSRIWGPSPVAMIDAQFGGSCVETYPDGNPVARHTYGGLAYVPSINSMLIYGGSEFCAGGNAGNDTWAFSLSGLSWQKKAYPPACAPCGDFGMVMAYDSVTGHVWLSSPSYYLYEYDPATNTYTVRSSAIGIGYGMSGAIDTKRNRFVFVGSYGVEMFDLNLSGTIPLQHLSTTGATGIVGTKFPGVVYDPVSDRIVAWNGGASVYTLNLDTLVWTRVDPAPSNTVTPTAGAAQGTYGRFQYSPSRNAFVAVNDIDQDVYVYKLSSGGGAPPDTIPPSPPTSLRPR